MEQDNRRNNEALFAQLEKYGPAQVRLMIATGTYPSFDRRGVLQWLKDKEQEDLNRAEASQSRQLQAALSSKRAAWAAVWLAILAILISLIAIVRT